MGFLGGGNKSGGGGRTDGNQMNSTSWTKVGRGSIDESGKVVGSFFQTAGATKSDADIDKMPLSGTKIIASVAKPLLAKGSKIRRSFFENQVIGNTKKGSNIKTTSEEFRAMSEDEKENLYSGYVKAIQTGQKDAYGRNPTPGGEGGSNMGSTTKTPQGIELAKAATGSATILGPAEIQKTAANTNTIKMSAAQTSVANKRKSRSSTIKTSATGLNNQYALAKKTLLG